jgi:hypothetical protein
MKNHLQGKGNGLFPAESLAIGNYDYCFFCVGAGVAKSCAEQQLDRLWRAAKLAVIIN